MRMGYAVNCAGTNHLVSYTAEENPSTFGIRSIVLNPTQLFLFLSSPGSFENPA